MLSRIALALILWLLWTIGALAGWGLDCRPPAGDNSVPIFTPELSDSESTSFRGLRLGLNRREARRAVVQLGLPIATVSERQMEFCAGSIRFAENGKLNKLELRPTYFAVSKVVLREFADAVFEHYKVRPAKVDDDVCFADVTCFRGTTMKGEKFLLLRIGADVVLHVSR